ncbi:MAG: polysaccharide deacetylase [Oscillospiraceae bacterium]|nr:polysaccharide deacetylase [Oscillospiraceae bacterium]
MSETEHGTQPYVIERTNAAPDPPGKTVYLTFDDGPSQYTPAVLDILDKYTVPATFFVLGNTDHTALLAEIVRRGYTIGLHSYNHKFEQIYRSSEAYFADLQKIDETVFEQTGIHSRLLRFPGGSSVVRGTARGIMKRLCREVQESGYQYFDWNCENGDRAGVTTVSGALSRIKRTAKDQTDENILIVLMHDTAKVTRDSLPEIIAYFKEQGYQFQALSESSPAVHHHVK